MEKEERTVKPTKTRNNICDGKRSENKDETKRRRENSETNEGENDYRCWEKKSEQWNQQRREIVSLMGKEERTVKSAKTRTIIGDGKRRANSEISKDEKDYRLWEKKSEQWNQQRRNRFSVLGKEERTVKPTKTRKIIGVGKRRENSETNKDEKDYRWWEKKSEQWNHQRRERLSVMGKEERAVKPCIKDETQYRWWPRKGEQWNQRRRKRLSVMGKEEWTVKSTKTRKIIGDGKRRTNSETNENETDYRWWEKKSEQRNQRRRKRLSVMGKEERTVKPTQTR